MKGRKLLSLALALLMLLSCTSITAFADSTTYAEDFKITLPDIYPDTKVTDFIDGVKLSDSTNLEIILCSIEDFNSEVPTTFSKKGEYYCNMVVKLNNYTNFDNYTDELYYIYNKTVSVLTNQYISVIRARVGPTYDSSTGTVYYTNDNWSMDPINNAIYMKIYLQINVGPNIAFTAASTASEFIEGKANTGSVGSLKAYYFTDTPDYSASVYTDATGTTSANGISAEVESGSLKVTTTDAVKNGTYYVDVSAKYETEEASLSSRIPVTVYGAILDTDNTTDTYLDSATVDQKYNATVNKNYSDVNKVQVSWKLEDIAATVTIDKKWNTETLTWDTTSASDSAEGATAEFNFVNLSSIKVAASVSFKAETAFANESGKTDKYSESYKVDGSDSDEAKSIIDSIVTDHNNPETLGTSAPSSKIEVTIEPKSGVFKDLTESANDQKFGTYTVKIGKVYAISSAIAGITLDKNVVEEGATDVEITLTATGVSMPKKVKIGDTGYTVTNNKITVASITSDIVIKEMTNYLTFTANEEGSTIMPNFGEGTFEYSLDGENWTKVETTDEAYYSTTITLTNVGDKVMFRGDHCITLGGYNQAEAAAFLCSSGSFAASGSVTSLTDGVGIDEDVELSDRCYKGMFSHSEWLTSAPELPATTLKEECYYSMFDHCTSLTKAPDLPAEELAVSCYSQMFKSCTSLEEAPELPAEKMVENCYFGMFWGCSSLKALSTISLDNLANWSCAYMFHSCKSLKVTNTEPTSGTYGVIFTCPDTTDIDEPVNSIFGWDTDNDGEVPAERFADTPVSGSTYYWYK